MLSQTQRVTLLCAVLLPATILGAPLLALAVPVLERHEALAAWAQAGGSVVAIALAMWIAALDGHRSRKAQERQADLQKEALDHQVRHTLSIQKQRRDAALNAIGAALFLYARAITEITAKDADYKSKISTYSRDLTIAHDILNKIDYADLINIGDMAALTHIIAMLRDADGAIEILNEDKVTENRERELLYRCILKRKINQSVQKIIRLGGSIPMGYSDEILLTPEEERRWEDGIKALTESKSAAEPELPGVTL